MTVFELVALATIVWNFRALKLVPYRLPARLMQAGCILLLGLYAVDLLRIVARDAMALYVPPTAWVKADLSLWFLLNFCMLMLVSFRAVESHRRKAHVDPLTDVLNRRGLQAELRPHLDAQAVGARVGVLMLDLDFFKSINDRFGHDGGDFVLQQLALTLEQCVRSSDLVARLGGEEFIVVLPGSSLEASAAQAERIRLRIADMPLDQLLPGLRITASIGVSCARLDDMPIAELMHVADLALYDAKDQGRNRVCCRSRGA
jgi:diguanylate cyclase (GGDEF)-like protein